MTTFLAIAENSRLEFESFACKATGTLEQVDGKFTMSEVLLEPSVTVLHSADRERAERVLQRTEANCLISNSIKSVVTMHTRVEISASENKRLG
jgi:organic hydroperoxide reductase OsmC/OhrA